MTSTEGEEPVCFFVRASYRDDIGASRNCKLGNVSELISLKQSPRYRDLLAELPH